MSVSLRQILSEKSVEASAPCRIDTGGTWDIKAMALPFERIEPTTVNIALSLRTSVTLYPYEEGRVKVSSDGFPQGQVVFVDNFPLEPPFGLFLAAVSYFDFHGLHIHIRSSSPVKSGLGGSSTALVALLKALSRISRILGLRGLSLAEILHLGYHLEDGVNGGNCGIQDQAAAVYGGVNQWSWTFGQRSSSLKRRPLLDRAGQRELSERLLLGYSGKSHVSLRTNYTWIREFLTGRTRAGWIKANEVVHHLALAIDKQDWKSAARHLRDEMALRREITPDAVTAVTAKLVSQAEDLGCGARFAGAGAGGAVWALGDISEIQTLKAIWQETLRPIKGAQILSCKVDPSGVK